MTQIYPIPSKPVPLSTPIPVVAPNPGYSVRLARPLALATCLLVAAAVAPFASYADGLTADAAPVTADELDIDDEDPDSADDGSSVLPDTFRLYDLRDVEPISAKEEEALLGNWGDSGAEDGD